MSTLYIVERALERNIDARNSDKVLQLEVWDQLGFGLSETQKKRFLSLPSTETINRIRRKLQEQGRYPATDTIHKTRQLKSMVVQQNMPKASPTTTERVLEELPTTQLNLEM